MISGAAFCVFLVLLTDCGGEENFPETSGLGNWPSSDGMQVDKKKGEEMIEALMHPEENRCYGKHCRSNDDCCVSAVCVDIEGVSGTCLPMYGKKFYQTCEQDKDCGNGFVCQESGNFDSSKTCQLEGRIMKKKAFNDPCSTSSECDSSKGLCCQVLRRHRMAPKKVCHYFIDPLSCVGQVETNLKPLRYIPNPFFKARLG